jgi:PKD repeat protein
LIGSFQEPREIVFGQPPEADFAYSPETPVAGSTVNFSGGLSKDPDGDISSYEWDFQGDGEIDESGKIVSHRFQQTGTYAVVLTVTDNDGNDVSVTKEISVEPSEEGS